MPSNPTIDKVKPLLLEDYPMKSHPILILSISSASLLMFMVLFGISEGASQQYFELINTMNQYSTDLISQAMPIRTIIGLDNIFIVLYTSVIILIVVQLKADGKSPKELLYIILACGLTAGALDFLENFHIITMLSGLENNIPIEPLEVKEQMVSSMFKWHLSYFAFFLLAFTLKPQNSLEKLFCFSLLFIQLPTGVFYYILEGTLIGDILFYVRYVNLFFGFILIGVIFNIRNRSTPTVSNNETHDSDKNNLTPTFS